MIDTHAHLDDEAFKGDLDTVLDRCRSVGVELIINNCASPESLDIVPVLAGRYDMIYVAAGIHPEYADSVTDADIQKVRDLCASSEKKILSVGEIGFDNHYDEGTHEEIGKNHLAQEELFLKQIEIAKEFKLPIEVHSRDACADTFEIIKRTGIADIGCDMHCYGYSKDAAKRYLELGCYLGIGGVSTFKNGRKLKETIEYAPLESLLLETDSPYLSPEPFRGKRNAPYQLMYVVKAIADIKKISEETVIEATTENAKRLFKRLAV